MNTRRMIICFFLMVAVSGLGNVVHSPFSSSRAYAEEEGGGKPKKKEKAKKKSGGESEKKSEDPNAPHPDFEYMDLKPMVLPVITERGLTQQVSLMVSLELPYGKTEEVETMEPKLTDAYLQDLYGALGAGGAMMRGGVIDVVAIKTRLTNVTKKVLGTERFNDVLLQVVQQRPM